MENASRAIIMAGGILIAVVIISVLVIVFNSISDVYSEEGNSLEVEQLEEYNRKFAMYNNSRGLYGSELLSLANLADEYNTNLRYSVGEDTNDQYYIDNEIKIDVDIYELIVDSEVQNAAGKTVKKLLKKGELKGTYDIKSLKAYYADLLNQNSSSSRSAATEFKSLLFKCDTSRTETNKYGRISYMYFEQLESEVVVN